MNVKKSLWGLLVLSFFAALPALAEDIKIEAVLIWGTNDEKSPNPKHKLVDAKTAESLRKVFAWKNYFEVRRKTGVVPNRGTNSFAISDECTIEIAELEGPKVGVLLIGKGKPQNRTVKALSRGESFILGGDVKDGSAWFIIISQLDEKAVVPAENKAAASPPKNGETKAAPPPANKGTNATAK